MHRRTFLQTAGMGACSGLFGCWAGSRMRSLEGGGIQSCDLPNIVLIFTDDQGYQDMGCFGSPDIDTPHLDRMAESGVRFTDFYVAQPVCGASRAGLLTGCYPNRIGLLGAPSHRARHGVHEDELTLAELVKQKGYATAIFGKWHLGHLPPFLPTRNGFDEYYGLPYSNDMWPYHPTAGAKYPPLPLMEGEEVIETNPDQRKLTTDYTERGVDFIRRHADGPFFLYVAHNMPHVPLHVSRQRADRSKRGLYGDVIMEIDWGVGRILETLRDFGILEKTLVIFTSDNGPWLSYGTHGGCALPLREGKGTTWEGGVRVPTLMHWKGVLPEGKVCDQPAMTIDLLPTVAALTGGTLPSHKIDGMNILPLMRCEPEALTPHEAFFFYWGRHLQAVRSGRWKLHFPHDYRTLEGRPGGRDGKPEPYGKARTELALFDLKKDISESRNVANEHPEVVDRIQSLAEACRADLGDTATGQKGQDLREPGRFTPPQAEG